MSHQILIRLVASTKCLAFACLATMIFDSPSNDRPQFEKEGFQFTHKEVSPADQCQPSAQFLRGKIDLDGTFLVPSGATEIQSPIPTHLGFNNVHGFSGQERSETSISEDVFEYRSGMLIPGRLEKKEKSKEPFKSDYAVFIPTLGAKIISINDYSPKSKVRIYNLPGYFEEKSKFKRP